MSTLWEARLDVLWLLHAFMVGSMRSRCSCGSELPYFMIAQILPETSGGLQVCTRESFDGCLLIGIRIRRSCVEPVMHLTELCSYCRCKGCLHYLMIILGSLFLVCQPFRELTFPKVKTRAACKLVEYNRVHWATISKGDIGQGLESLASEAAAPSGNEQVA